jgi:hypothetical protein
MTTRPPSCADCLEIWEPEAPGTLGPVQACNGIALPLPLPLIKSRFKYHGENLFNDYMLLKFLYGLSYQQIIWF